MLLRNRGLAVLELHDAGDNTIMYWYCTVLCTTFMFIVLKQSIVSKLEFDGKVFVPNVVNDHSSLSRGHWITHKWVLFCIVRFYNITVLRCRKQIKAILSFNNHVSEEWISVRLITWSSGLIKDNIQKKYSGNTVDNKGRTTLSHFT
jgi:hypothetical protein